MCPSETMILTISNLYKSKLSLKKMHHTDHVAGMSKAMRNSHSLNVETRSEIRTTSLNHATTRFPLDASRILLVIFQSELISRE